MQNNVTYLSRKLQRSLDNNYNVIDMPAVIEIISTLEKTSVTKELLETTRLGKYINELRRKTSNESLAKRAKELLKKWRDLILPDANGQIRSTSANSEQPDIKYSKKRPASATPPNSNSNSNSNNSAPATKKLNLNGSQSRGGGGGEYDFSDNSNCSMTMTTTLKDFKKTDVIFINSDSNSSMPETVDHFNDASNDASSTTEQLPKKRGRKKGSKNHKNLVIAAEESFTNKMAVSRNSKVKTTQELLADIQNRKPSSQDIELRTAQLTESLTRIEHKLNPQKQVKSNVIIEVHKTDDEDDEIVDVVGDPPGIVDSFVNIDEINETPLKEVPFTIENILKQLPPVDKTCLDDEANEFPNCDCPTPVVEQQQQVVSVEIVSNLDTTRDALPKYECERERERELERELDDPITVTEKTDTDDRTSCSGGGDCVCAAKQYLNEKYHLDEVGDSKVAALHDQYIPNVNGNYAATTTNCNIADDTKTHVNFNLNLNCDVDENIVPNFMSERLHKRPNENFQKYSISIDNKDATESGEGTSKKQCDSDSEKFRTETSTTSDLNEFREWHETLDVISYNDELLRILPYVIID